jgi:hypothetical protein
VDDAEKRVAKLQAEVAKFDTALNAPDLYAKDPAHVTKVTMQRADAAKLLEAAESKWLAAIESFETARDEVERGDA